MGTRSAPKNSRLVCYLANQRAVLGTLCTLTSVQHTNSPSALSDVRDFPQHLASNLYIINKYLTCSAADYFLIKSSCLLSRTADKLFFFLTKCKKLVSSNTKEILHYMTVMDQL